MITIKLKELMREKNLSINKVSIETGISRPALTALVNNESKGIQFDTLEKIIDYFNVSISDVLSVENENVTLYFKSTIPLSKIKASEAAEFKEENETDNFIQKNPSEILVFDAEIVENGIKSEPFEIAISPVINQNKILVLTIVIYRTDDGGKEKNVSDINIFLGKLDTEAAIKFADTLIMTWAKFYNEISKLNDKLTNLLMIQINLVGRKTRIPLVANIEQTNNSLPKLNFDLFRKNSPIIGNSEYSKNIEFHSMD